MGRPTKFNAKTADAVCARLAEGKSMRQIARTANMPDRTTLQRWVADNEEFAARCARAREIGADVIFDELEDIEQKTLTGKLDPQAAKVVVSSRQWRLSKLSTKKYGDKQQVDVNAQVSIADAILAARSRTGAA